MATVISNGLKCPKCSAELKEFSSQDLKLARCFSCHGIWFDKNELKKVIDERDMDLSWMHLIYGARKRNLAPCRGRSCVQNVKKE